jgi:two-component system sensor histidine kinase KdpD
MPSHFLDNHLPPMLLIVVIALVATRWGMKAALFTCTVAVLVLDYYFIPPLGTLAWDWEPRDFVMVVTFVATALTIGQLSVRLQRRAQQADQAKSEVDRLYEELQAGFEAATQGEALRRTAEHLKLAEAVAQIGSLDYFIQTGTVSWSDSLYDVLGVNRSVAPSREQWLAAAHPEDRERISGAVNDFLTSDDNQVELDYRIVKPGGAVCWINARLGLFRDSSGTPVRLLGAVIDVTNRKRSEEEARAAERFKSTLLDCLTHDLRAPLTSIKIAATSLLRNRRLRTIIEEPQRELLEVIDEEIERLDHFVDNLVSMARVEAGELNLRISAATAKDIVAEALDRAQRLSAQPRFQTRLPEDLPAVSADRRAVAQVVYTLLENACKYAYPDTSILIAANHSGNGEVQFFVENTGPKIPYELRDRVFDKFYRIKEAALRGDKQPTRITGCGMGLAIARGIIQAQHGSIWIEDPESGHGTRVVFTLPTYDPNRGESEYQI